MIKFKIEAGELSNIKECDVALQALAARHAFISLVGRKSRYFSHKKNEKTELLMNRKAGSKLLNV